MDGDIIKILLVGLILLGVIFIFISIAMRVRKKGGSMTTLMYRATDEFYNDEKKKAIEYTVELKAGKKLNRQNSGDTR